MPDRHSRSWARPVSTAAQAPQSVGTAAKSPSIGPRNQHQRSERLMRIGVPKEIKVHEYRVGLTPASVAELVAHGHEVVVEARAGDGIDWPDKAFEKAGAKILPAAASVFEAADMIVKVKEPQPQEIALLEPRHILFTYLHLAADD